MKKVLIAAALVGVMSFAGISMVNAHGRHGFDSDRGYGVSDGYGRGDGYCRNRSYSDQDREKAAAFLESTKEIRKQMAVKRSERRALMKQENPDAKRVAQLTGEIFDLRDTMAQKAKETFGDNPPPFGLMGPRGGFGDHDRGPRNF